jgi:hypothetical protein
LQAFDSGSKIQIFTFDVLGIFLSDPYFLGRKATWIAPQPLQRQILPLIWLSLRSLKNCRNVASVRRPKTKAMTSPESWSIKCQVQRGSDFLPTNDQNSSVSARLMGTLSRFLRLRLKMAGLTTFLGRPLFFNSPKHRTLAHAQHTNGVPHPAAIDRHVQYSLFDACFTGLVLVTELERLSASQAPTSLMTVLAFAYFITLSTSPHEGQETVVCTIFLSQIYAKLNLKPRSNFVLCSLALARLYLDSTYHLSNFS